MKLFLLCVLALGSVVAQGDSELEDYFDDYDNTYDDAFMKEQGAKLDGELKEFGDNWNIQDASLEELKRFLEKNNQKSKVNDFKIGDSKEEREKEGRASVESPENLDNIETLAKNSNEQDSKKDETDSEEAKRRKEASDDYALLWGVDEPSPLPAPIAGDKAIFDETQEILNEDDDVNDFEEEKKDINIPANDQSNLEEIFDETKKLLADNENDFDISKTSSEKTDQVSTTKEQIASEEDTVDKVKEDLDDDLRQLLETLDKLSNDHSEEDQGSQEGEEAEEVNASSVLDYEEKYGKPYHEGVVLSQRGNDDDYEEMDSNLSELFKKSSEVGEVSESVEQEKSEPNPDDDMKENTSKKTDEPKYSTTIMYQNDALVDEDNKASSDEVEQFSGAPGSTQESKDTFKKEDDLESTSTASVASESTAFVNSESTTTSPVTTEKMVRTKMVDELTSEEFDEVMKQFAIVNSEDFDTNAESFNRDVAPIHITLKVGEPTVVTSPNYPLNYPNNNIIDWIFEGEGVGIELNVTDFAVNGAIGDYVLIKPGGIDATGQDGIIFSYRLNSERKFRFTDVDKLFMRFESKLGMSLRGFNMSLQFISPLPEDPEDIPEPEAVVHPPSQTLTVNLAGVNVIMFKKIREDFRLLVADMASLYIRDNKIDPGMNTTIDVTQVTNQALCNIHWPGHEDCVEVTFGVPLTYEEDLEYRLHKQDLQDMWNTYTQREEFKRRMLLLGIEEFITPDDRSVLSVWLVIAAGVVISMAMLAFALWRFSCFDDYTRMQAFSDTDSIKNQKRDLDLYPTPHQTLPPLYSENEYKWPDHKFDDTARVDMPGFANQGYVRNDMYDFESDEEVIPSRDRNNAVSSRDIFSV